MNTMVEITVNRKIDDGPIVASLYPGIFYEGGNERAVTDVYTMGRRVRMLVSGIGVNVFDGSDNGDKRSYPGYQQA